MTEVSTIVTTSKILSTVHSDHEEAASYIALKVIGSFSGRDMKLKVSWYDDRPAQLLL